MIRIAKRSKYGAVATVVDGVRFASKSEAKRDGELKLLERGGKIRNLKRQPRYPLMIGGVKVGEYRADWEYIDFACDDAPILVAEDRKGVRTPLFNLKFKIAKVLYPDVEFRLS